MTASPRYGRVIVVLAALAMVATLPGRTHGLALITESLLADLHVDRVDFATINLWATLVGAAFCLPAGWAIDRLGLRLTTAFLLVATGGCAWALTRTGGAFLPLLIVVTLTRGFGQSALSVASITAVGKWHPDRSGPAMGAYALLLGLFFVAAFGVVAWVLREHGWKTAWTGVAAGVALVIGPLLLLLLREPPADRGGKAPVATGYSLREALGTPAFWVFAGSSAVFLLVSSGFGLFQEAVFRERGFDQKTYHDVLVVTTFLALGVQFLAGWLSLRWSSGSLTAVAMVLYALALAMIPRVGSLATLWTAACLMGAAGATITVVFFAVWGQAFGLAHLGRIQAAAQMLTVLASAVGPLLFARVQARTGSYSPALYGLAPVVLLLGLAAWRVRMPPPPTGAAPT